MDKLFCFRRDGSMFELEGYWLDNDFKDGREVEIFKIKEGGVPDPLTLNSIKSVGKRTDTIPNPPGCFDFEIDSRQGMVYINAKEG